MSRKLWYLKQLDIFKTLPEKQIQHISEKLHAKEYDKRQVILEPEDHDKVFILKSGRVEMYQLTPDGKKIIIDVLGAGNVFGDLGIDEPTEVFVEATADSYVCVMGKGEFFDMVTKNPKISAALVKELFTKIVESEKRVAAVASNNLTTKVKNLLLRLAKKHGNEKNGRIVISTKFTHEQLAAMIGVSRQTMTTLLNQLERQGVIGKKRKIISFNPQRLVKL